jgi:integral membrane sensor domain MASE1
VQWCQSATLATTRMVRAMTMTPASALIFELSTSVVIAPHLHIFPEFSNRRIKISNACKVGTTATPTSGFSRWHRVLTRYNRIKYIQDSLRLAVPSLPCEAIRFFFRTHSVSSGDDQSAPSWVGYAVARV